MLYLIRKADEREASQLEQLLVAYMRETYKSAWGGNVRRLEQDIMNKAFETLVAETTDGKLVGFVAWTTTYDLHWCLKGGVVIDYYVAPSHRGRGAAILLTVELAAEIYQRNGAFLHSGAIESAVVRRFYNRIAMLQPNGECYISGRAFRHLAGLSGKSAREIVKNLPQTAWNFEP